MGQGDFSKPPKENKNPLEMSTACLFKEIDAKRYFSVKARENRESIEALNMDSRFGHYVRVIFRQRGDM